MRFMLFMYPRIASEDWEPDPEAVARMGAFNEELVKRGLLLAADGLHPQEEGARVTYAGGTPTVTDGPFTEAKEVVGGYWLIQAGSLDEAVEWARRVPADEHNMVEVRRVFELDEFPPEVQEAARLSETPPEQTSA